MEGHADPGASPHLPDCSGRPSRFGVFSLTGRGLKISSLIRSLSGGYTIPALFLALLASMIVGLSLPITATYIMTVVMVAPALVKVGLQAHVAHMLAFYFAVLSEVYPPVGLCP